MSPRLRVVHPEDPVERRRRARAIGSRIRQLRLERGMTQAQLAGERFTKAYISALETGNAAPSMRSLDYVASRLRVTPDWFLTDRAPGEEVVLPATIARARFADGRVYVDLDDGRSIGMPLARSRRLMAARADQYEGWEVTESGRAIAWPAIGEELSLEDFFGSRVLAPEEVNRTRPRDAAKDVPPRRRGRPGGRYAALSAWLAQSRKSEMTATFDELDAVLGRPLPPSARQYAAPWSTATSPLARAIHSAGWRASPDLAGSRVAFRRR